MIIFKNIEGFEARMKTGGKGIRHKSNPFFDLIKHSAYFRGDK